MCAYGAGTEGRWNIYLAGLLAGRLELGLLAHLFDLLVLGQAVGLLGAKAASGVLLLSEDFPATREGVW